MLFFKVKIRSILINRFICTFQGNEARYLCWIFKNLFDMYHKKRSHARILITAAHWPQIDRNVIMSIKFLQIQHKYNLKNCFNLKVLKIWCFSRVFSLELTGLFTFFWPSKLCRVFLTLYMLNASPGSGKPKGWFCNSRHNLIIFWYHYVAMTYGL